MMGDEMYYRLALDVGSNSLGWAVIRLKFDEETQKYFPMAIVRAGSRVFPDGRHPKTGVSNAVERRMARGQRRRRDRYLRRRSSMLRQLVRYGFFPDSIEERKALVKLDPYEIRARGLDEELKPEEFGRALFHINQRRGFKSNRKTDAKDNEHGIMKQAITDFKEQLQDEGVRTVGEMLYKRLQNGLPARARLRTQVIPQANGRNRNVKSYDLYIDRGMMEEEFEQLWESQKRFNPEFYNDEKKEKLWFTVFHQRPLRPICPGRCTFFPDEERAAVALPIAQKFKLLQEVNHLRYVGEKGQAIPLTLEQRNLVLNELVRSRKCTFTQLRKKLNFPGYVRFTIEDSRRTELPGDLVSAELSKKTLFGSRWFGFGPSFQTQIVKQLLEEENEKELISWLVKNTGVDEVVASKIIHATLPSGYINLSEKALSEIVPVLEDEVITYDKAVKLTSIGSHSEISKYHDGEIMEYLPYYGEVLHRHVGFGTNNVEDSDEVRYGKINNPTVHIGLNQIRVVINALIREYGHPKQVIVELARDLKLSAKAKERIKKEQTVNQQKNKERREKISHLLPKTAEAVTRDDLQKYILWEELSPNPLERCCPYTGEPIPCHKIFSSDVEVEHILPFSMTLDDSINNKTLSYVHANRAKGNRTPYQAFGKNDIEGYDYQAILARTEVMSKQKSYRFAIDGYERWLREHDGFLARALNDTAYMSRLAKEYVSVICPGHTTVVPGQLTGFLRRHLGLNNILGVDGEKNRNDHRHHAVDACVIGITDRALLKRFADANKFEEHGARSRLLQRVEDPWPTYREQVKRAVHNIWVSHKPDHGHQGQMHNETAFGQVSKGRFRYHKSEDGKRTPMFRENPDAMISITSTKAKKRHGTLPDGTPKPYKYYLKDSNYCIEIYREDNGKWSGNIVSTFEAYQIVKKQGLETLRNPKWAQNGKLLVMRLMRDDMVRLEHNDRLLVVRLCKINSSGQMFFAEHFESNVAARSVGVDKDFDYISKTPNSLKSSEGRIVTISPTGRLHDPGFRE